MGSHLADLIPPRSSSDYESIDQRPWYSYSASDSCRWVTILRDKISRSEIKIADVRKEIHLGKVRPSLEYQLTHTDEHPLQNWEALQQADKNFYPPEFNVSFRRLFRIYLQNVKRYPGWIALNLKKNALERLPIKSIKKILRPVFKIKTVWSKLNLFYEIAYGISFGIYKIRNRSELSQKLTYDIVFVLNKKTTDRIKESVCCEIATHGFKTYCIHYTGRLLAELPNASIYYFADQMEFPRLLKHYPFLWGKTCFVFYTQPFQTSKRQLEELLFALKFCKKILCMNSKDADFLKSKKVQPNKIQCVYSGVNSEKFKRRTPHASPVVGFCSGYHPGKNPDFLMQIVQSMPEQDFLLLAPHIPPSKANREGWCAFPKFNQLRALPNLTLKEVPYGEFPGYFQKMDVFVSISQSDSGPLSLLEAMMCDLIPVASEAGFSSELIQHGKNGFIFKKGDTAEVLRAMIRQALQLKADVRSTVQQYDWNAYVSKLKTIDSEEKTSRQKIIKIKPLFQDVKISDNSRQYLFRCHTTRDMKRATSLFTKESGTIQWIKENVKNGDVFFDIGANIGIYTVFAGDKVGPDGKVYAFEPHAANTVSLLKNIELNQMKDRVELYSVPLSHTESIESYQYFSTQSAGSGVLTQPSNKNADTAWFHTVSIDTLIESGHIPYPNHIKIDTDGSEMKILKGMKKLLTSRQSPQTIQIEIEPSQREKIGSAMEKMGYIFKYRHETMTGQKHIDVGNDPEKVVYNAVYEKTPDPVELKEDHSTELGSPVYSFEKNSMRYDPYPLAVIEDFINPDFYTKMQLEWPEFGLFESVSEYQTQKFSLAEVKNPELYLSFIQGSGIWNRFYRQIKSSEFIRQTLNFLLQNNIDIGLAKNKKLWGKLRARFEFSMMPADGGAIMPHTDVCGKIITLVIMMPDLTWDPVYGGGTSILKPKDRSRNFNLLNEQIPFEEVETLETIPYKSNQCVLFVKTFNSLHGVFPMQGPNNVMRKSLTINIENPDKQGVI